MVYYPRMTQVSTTPPPAADGPKARSRAGRRSVVHPGRAALAIVVSSLIFLAADFASSYVLIAAAFGGPSALLGIVVVVAVTATIVAVTVSSVTGSRRIAGPVLATLVTAMIGALALLMGVLTPMIGDPATPVAHLLICVGGALILGLFLGPWPFRVAGAIAAVGLVVFAAVIAPPLPQDSRPPASGNREEIEANFEHFLDHGTRPLITDDRDWDVAYLDASGGPATSVIVGPRGGATTVVVDNTDLDGTWDRDAFACWQLTDRYTSPDTESTFVDWSDRCAKTADGWEALDGSGFAWTENNMLILLLATRPNEFTEVAEAKPAGTSEMSELRGLLRPMTKDEMREEFTEWFLGPEQWR